MADASGDKTGGRTRGTPNKSTREVKAFLERVFTRAFTEKRAVTVSQDGGRTFNVEQRSWEDRLVDDIIRGQIDPGELKMLLAYFAGVPRQAFDLNHRGKVTLEQLLAGTAPKSDDPEDPT